MDVIITYHGHNNPVYNVHQMWECIVHGKIWVIFPGTESHKELMKA